ncbi:hypothetical protein PG996_015548 [Apiospora saccharicola]|uniref:F-box domain-containing protein n=1 Tax=Apiospora saccharicola TaxID=335842 RepID=A0ABR1TLI1_9PEZI
MAGLVTLPEEVLLQILKDVAQASRSDIFFPECREVKGPSKGYDYAVRTCDNFPMDIHYPHSNTTVRYGRYVTPDAQWEHISDWLVLNSTCTRIRRLGREAWYCSRTFAMYSNLPTLIKGLGLDRGLPAPYEPQSQVLKLAHTMDLSRIERVVFVDNYENTSAGLLALPKSLSLFPELRHCVLVYGYTRRATSPLNKDRLPANRAYGILQTAVTGESIKSIKEHMKKEEEEGEENRKRIGMPRDLYEAYLRRLGTFQRLAFKEQDENNRTIMSSELQDFVHRFGVSEKVHIDLRFPLQSDSLESGLHTPYVLLARLKKYVWPVLHLKDRVLKEQEAQQQGVSTFCQGSLL